MLQSPSIQSSIFILLIPRINPKFQDHGYFPVLLNDSVWFQWEKMLFPEPNICSRSWKKATGVSKGALGREGLLCLGKSILWQTAVPKAVSLM